jgi:hypothetical protein
MRQIGVYSTFTFVGESLGKRPIYRDLTPIGWHVAWGMDPYPRGFAVGPIDSSHSHPGHKSAAIVPRIAVNSPTIPWWRAGRRIAADWDKGTGLAQCRGNTLRG